jgi:hypothetical protein
VLAIGPELRRLLERYGRRLRVDVLWTDPSARRAWGQTP